MLLSEQPRDWITPPSKSYSDFLQKYPFPSFDNQGAFIKNTDGLDHMFVLAQNGKWITMRLIDLGKKSVTPTLKLESK